LDYLEAAKWTRRAAEQGYALAETDFGYFYEQGKGVPLDYVTAYMWSSAGTAAGDDRASTRIRALSQLMEPRQINEAKKRAFSKMLKAGPDSSPASAAGQELINEGREVF